MLMKNFIKNSLPDDMREGIQQMVVNGTRLIGEVKLTYSLKVSRTLPNPENQQKHIRH